jgi:hypothetical protein
MLPDLDEAKPDEVVDAWRETVTRGARLVCFAPLVALALAPVAVFCRPALMILALWHGYGIWRLTVHGAPSATSRLSVWRWVLRVLALAGVLLITLDYEVYRALLIATSAAYLAYLSELLPALGLQPRKSLRHAALGAASCCAVVAGDLLLRRWLNGSWGAAPGHCVAALALPLGVLAWLEVDRVREPGADTDPKEPEEHSFPVRSWAQKVSQIVIPFSLGAGVVIMSVMVGFWAAWQRADLEPGTVTAMALFILLCVDGAILLLLRKRSRQTLRRTVVGAALTHVPLWWFFVFPTQFAASEWKRSPEASKLRSDMAEDLIYSRVLLGKTRSEVVELLGSRGSYSGPDEESYSLRSHLCKGFLVRYDGETAVAADFFWCG